MFAIEAPTLSTVRSVGDRPRPGLSTKPGPLIALSPNLCGSMPVSSREASTSRRKRGPMGSRLLGVGIVSAVPRRTSEPRPSRPGHDASPGTALPRAQCERCSQAMCALMLCTSALWIDA